MSEQDDFSTSLPLSSPSPLSAVLMPSAPNLSMLMPPPSMTSSSVRPSWLDAWLAIPGQIGKKVGRTLFVPFKAPITSSNYPVPSTKIFSVKDVMAQFRNNQQELGLVVEITDEEDLLSSQEEWKTNNIQRVRLAPSSFLNKSSDSSFLTANSELLMAFIRVVDSFTKNSNKLVGVCCVDGYVLTGLLIVGYMVEEGCSLETALVQFAKARPPGLFHWPYIEFLQSHFHEPEQKRPSPPVWASALPAPPKHKLPPPMKPLTALEHAKLKRRIPKRKTLEDGSINVVNGSSNSSSNSSSSSSSSSNSNSSSNSSSSSSNGNSANTSQPRAHVCPPPTNCPFFIPVTEEEVKQVGNKVEGLLRSAQQSGDPFFGDVRVPLQTSSLPLNAENMIATWSPAGPTLVLAILTEGSFFLSQLKEGYGVWKCSELTFKQRKNSSLPLDGTLVIGELVEDVAEGLTTPRFLIRDLLIFAGTSLMQRSLTTRQQCATAEILTPWSQQPESRSSRLRVRLQTMFPLNKTPSILNMKIPHATRGVVFIASKGPYGSPLVEWNSESAISQSELLQSVSK